MNNQRMLELSVAGESALESLLQSGLRIVSKKKDEFIIAGYASVDIIDLAHEEIPLTTLKDMIDRFMVAGYEVISYEHETPYPVGRVIKNYGEYKTQVDDIGLFIVAEIRGDTETGKRARAQIEGGEYASFSVHIEVLDSQEVCEKKQCYTRITKANLLEISVVKEPANQASHFKVIKKAKDA